MKKKRIMIIGPRGCGKTTLAHRINDDPRPPRRTQDTIYGTFTIDVPSGYLENRWMYRHLIALAQDAWCIVMMHDQRKKDIVYSPGFAKTFNCPIVGVISHSGEAKENKDALMAQFVHLGIEAPYFEIDLNSGEGMQALLTYLQELRKGGR